MSQIARPRHDGSVILNLLDRPRLFSLPGRIRFADSCRRVFRYESKFGGEYAFPVAAAQVVQNRFFPDPLRKGLENDPGTEFDSRVGRAAPSCEAEQR